MKNTKYNFGFIIVKTLKHIFLSINTIGLFILMLFVLNFYLKINYFNFLNDNISIKELSIIIIDIFKILLLVAIFYIVTFLSYTYLYRKRNNSYKPSIEYIGIIISATFIILTSISNYKFIEDNKGYIKTYTKKIELKDKEVIIPLNRINSYMNYSISLSLFIFLLIVFLLIIKDSMREEERDYIDYYLTKNGWIKATIYSEKGHKIIITKPNFILLHVRAFINENMNEDNYHLRMKVFIDIYKNNLLEFHEFKISELKLIEKFHDEKKIEYYSMKFKNISFNQIFLDIDKELSYYINLNNISKNFITTK